MARQIVSGNLNQWGNAGNFETDRSTWGFADSAGVEFTRSLAEFTKGNSSAKVRAKASNEIENTVVGAFTAEVGKLYLVKAKLKTTPWGTIVGTPYYFGHDDVELKFTVGFASGLTIDSSVSKTVADIKDTWAEIEATISVGLDGLNVVYIGWDKHGQSVYNPNAFFFVDEFEIYEYIEVEDPPPAGCTLAISSIDITNESAPSAGDGSFIVNTTGGTGTLEYSKNNGSTWQLSNTFTGLGANVYFVKVREQAIPTCEKSQAIVINHGAVAFDFTMAITNESVAGAEDGEIAITPTGSGTPWTYSKDGGATFQSSNVFSGLLPGVYYIVVKSTTGILLMKEAAVLGGAQQFDKIYFSKNFITLQKQAVSNWLSLVNYRLYNDVRVEEVADSNAYISKLKVDLVPALSGSALFHLAEAFRDIFDFTPPSLNASDIIRLTSRIKRFINYSGELQDSQTVPGSLTASLPNLVLFGGIDKVNYPNIDFFNTYLPANKKFLTWAPLTKLVDKLQEDYLTYFIFGNSSTLKLSITAYYDDGTDETQVTKTKIGTTRAQVYQIPAGPSNSGAALINPAKNLIKYTISLLNQSDSLISEVRTYIIAPYRHPRTRFFLFINSLGGYEVLRFTGVAGKKTEFSREVIQKYLSANYASQDGEFEVNTSIMSERGNYSSGLVDKQWHEYLKDFLLSKRVYDVTTGKRIPVAILGSEHNDEDQDYTRYIRFEARPAYDNTSFTPAQI